MCLLVAVNMMDRTTISIALPYIKDELHLSPTVQGLVLSGFFWSYTLMQLPAGWLLDRFGPRKVITVATGMWGISQLCMAVVSGGLSLIFARLFLGVAEAPMSPGNAKLTSAWLARSERARGAVLIDCGSPIGIGLGGITIAYLIATLDSWRLSFIIVAVFSLLLSIVAWRKLKDKPSDDPRINQAEIDLIENDAFEKNSTDEIPVEVKGLGIHKVSMLAIIVARFFWSMIYFGLLTWGPSYLSQARGFDIKSVGNATFFIFLLGGLGALSYGFLVDYMVKKGISRNIAFKSLFSLSGLVAFGIFLYLPHISDPIVAVGLLSLASFFVTGVGSVYWSLPALLAHKSRAGLVGGIMNMAGSVGGILIPIIVGLILQFTASFNGVLMLFAFCSIMYLLGSLLIRFDGRSNQYVGKAALEVK
ncbi:MFS transporter [Rouxiella sp. Mn2063]|uniref:MFS transporter n=1 Tax=Rouxiella sp. Mn2063 TaxID=3395262 RepID=UPI003BBAECF9